MASKKAVTSNNLAALGAERLAAILVGLADGDAEIKRRLRLELAAEEGGDSIAAEISKRITALSSARSFVDWQKQRDFVRDVDLQRAMIVDRVAAARAELGAGPHVAVPRTRRAGDQPRGRQQRLGRGCFPVGLRGPRCDRHPCQARSYCPGRSGRRKRRNHWRAAPRTGLVPIMLPALGNAGAAHLQGRLAQALAKRPTAKGWDGPAEAARQALQDIADGQEDVDAYIALVPAANRSKPHFAAEIGRRLLAAGRAAEALAALEFGKAKRRTGRASDEDTSLLGAHGADGAWEEAYIEALDATGQQQEGQRLRWAAFEERLSSTNLRAYLKRLADFEDVEAEERAMQHALRFASFSSALDFFRQWPDQSRAAQLVIARAAEIDGNLYFLLNPAAQMIEGKHPMAATLLRRAMIEDTLNGAKSTRYKHAARHLRECASLAPGVLDFGEFETHESFVARLRLKHGRKAGFWGQLGEEWALGDCPLANRE